MFYHHNEFWSILKNTDRVMGLDISKKKIGVALSDPEKKVATPLKTIDRTKFTQDIAALHEIINSYSIGGLVIGFPLNMDGSEGPRCQSIKDLSKDLYTHLKLPILFQDERLTTVSAENFLNDEIPISIKKTRKSIDKLAAYYILKTALDKRKFL